MHKIGIKAGFPNVTPDFLETVKPYIDFLEWSMTQSMNWENIDTAGIPIKVVHISYWNSPPKINLADAGVNDRNIRELKESIRIADYHKSESIVIHPERTINENCSLDNVVYLLNKVKDTRFAIENMSARFEFFEEEFLGQNAEELKYVIDRTNIRSCFDIGHASCYAYAEGLDFKKYYQSFFDLKPLVYHFSDDRFFINDKGICPDQHLHLGKGDIDWELVLSMMPEDSIITLETSPDGGHEDDVKLIRRLEKKK